MNYNTIQIEREEGIITITLNRPKQKNAMNQMLLNELGDVVNLAESDPSIKVLIITGGPQFFSAGADLTDAQKIETAQDAFLFSRRFQSLFYRMEELGKPIIAAINGFALGGGLELALACDYRIASEGALLGVPEIQIGAFPAGGGSQKLPRYIGLTKALELLFEGDPINAEEAFRINLINKVVKKEVLMETVKALAVKLCAKAPLAIQAIKTLAYKGLQMDFNTALNYEGQVFGKLLASEDSREGLLAFFEKRPPIFKGK